MDQESAMLDLRTVINNLPIAIFVIGKDRRILLNNRLAQKYLCLDQQESEAMRFGDQVGCANAVNNTAGCGATEYCKLCRVKSEIDDAFKQKKSTSHFETDIITGAMGIRSFRMSINYICLNTVKRTEKELCIVTMEDLTELKKKEQLAAASETIGAVCHELNQPLQAILGNVELLAGFQVENKGIKRMEKICSEIERIKSIINKLMNVTQYQTKPYLSAKILDIEKSAMNSVDLGIKN